MGISKFWTWFNRNYGKNIHKLKSQENFQTINIGIDNLMIDLNGIFHNSTQKIYEYGAYKSRKSFLNKKKHLNNGIQTQIKVFSDICDRIDYLVKTVNPKKRLILCVDGPAPLAKQSQQRSRRFRSSLDKENDSEREFDSCCITPGTKFMDFLTKYIDWYIRKKITEDINWQKLNVIFSNEKVPGEGEAKCLNFVRKHNKPEESYCLHGMDADLIMLSLGTHIQHFYILRDDMYDIQNNFFVVDIGKIANEITSNMKWSKTEKSAPFSSRSVINDFIFMCFMVGNDFLPHVPSLEIIEGGIDTLIEIYKKVGEEYGHLTKCQQGPVVFRKKSLRVFFETISQYEKLMLESKCLRKDKYLPDPILESNSKFVNNHYVVDIEQYRSDYYEVNFEDEKLNLEEVAHQYIEGMQWVLSYYTTGISNWKWSYKYHYAPFAFNIKNHVNSYKRVCYPKSNPTPPFLQLLLVLPPQSCNLLPKQFETLFSSSQSPLKTFYPETFNVDMSGKKNDWEGVVLLPIINYNVVEFEYLKLIKTLDQQEQKRNNLGNSFSYKYSSENKFMIKSFYGNFESLVHTSLIKYL